MAFIVMVLSLNRYFSPGQPHYFARFGRAIESGKHDHGEIHSQSEIKAARRRMVRRRVFH
jgi:hypothetical protein